MEELQEGDIVKIEPSRIGLISEVTDDTMIRVGEDWFDPAEVEVRVLHRESSD